MSTKQKISKITLGTVQLGIPYGIANKQGQPSEKYSHLLLKTALENGITTLDTARSYGNSEEVIGSFERSEEFTIVSKFKLSDAAFENPALALEEARQSIKVSLKNLGISMLPICMYHTKIDQDMKRLNLLIPDLFEKLIEEGLIAEGGISLETPDPLSQINNWKNINSVQVPMNVLDTRLLQDGRMQALMENGVKVFIRSIYLQGLILMEETELPAHLLAAKPYLQSIRSIASGMDKTVQELAFAFVRDTPGVSSIIVGADTIEQLAENAGLLLTPSLPEGVHQEIQERFKEVPGKTITPALWKK